MTEFFAALKRRQMFRVAAAYAVVAWLLLQVVNNVAPVLDLPVWVARAFLLLLAIGFPITLLLSWARDQAPPGAAPKAATTKFDYVLAGGLAAVIALLLYQQLTQSSGPGSVQPQQNDVLSIAVLPLANLSGDNTQEFFSDGMTDEITSALAKIRDFRVVGRSSAFQFKGQNRDLRAIGQALSARYLIDGSVRKVGTRVRITAQLIEASNGVNVWTENYERELIDVFAIQEDIAEAIASALRVPLGLQQGETVVRNRTNNTASYDDYLRAKQMVRTRGLRTITDAAAILEQVVARDPDYAPAWALLSEAYAATPNFHPSWTGGNVAEARSIVNASVPKAEAAALKSLQIDPNLGSGHGALGYSHEVRGNLLMAEELYLKALASDPNSPDFLNYYSQLLAKVGRLKESLALRERLQVLEPFVPVFHNNTAGVLWLNGQTDAAIEMLRAGQAGARAFDLARIYASVGRYAEAADTLLEIPAGADAPGTLEETVRLLRIAAANGASSASPGPLKLNRLGFVHVYLGDPARVLEFYEDNAESGYFSSAAPSRVWHSSYAPARKTERFKALVRKMGLIGYWRAKGWPEFCRPTTGDDFECN